MPAFAGMTGMCLERVTMPTYTVHAPPPRPGETTSAPERFVFVRDGFYGWAFLLTPFWLLVRRLWLVLLGYVVASFALGVVLRLLVASALAQFIAGLVVSLLVGFEASTLWRWTLDRRGWQPLGFVVGDDREVAERRFFAAWADRAAEPPASRPATSEPQYSAAVRRGAPSSSDVIGLFPEPRQ